jgi:hypothetical protein
VEYVFQAKVLKEEKRLAAEMIAKAADRQKKKLVKQGKLNKTQSTASGLIAQLDSSVQEEEEELSLIKEEEDAVSAKSGSLNPATSSPSPVKTKTKDKEKKKSIFHKMPWRKGEADDASMQGEALVPLDKEGSHVDSQTVGSQHHSHAGESAGEDAEEMNEPSGLLEAGGGDRGEENEVG